MTTLTLTQLLKRNPTLTPGRVKRWMRRRYIQASMAISGELVFDDVAVEQIARLIRLIDRESQHKPAR